MINQNAQHYREQGKEKNDDRLVKFADYLDEQQKSCAHVDATGPTVHLGSIGDFSDYSEAVWECDNCGEIIPQEMYDKLDLNDPDEAYAESLADQAEQQRDYEATR